MTFDEYGNLYSSCAFDGVCSYAGLSYTLFDVGAAEESINYGS